MIPSDNGGPAGVILVHVDANLENLIPRFLDNRRDDVAAMEQALTQNDFETIKNLAHGLKGCGGGFGFDEISRIGVTLEQAAKAKDRAEIQKSLGRLTQYLTIVEIVYD